MDVKSTSPTHNLVPLYMCVAFNLRTCRPFASIPSDAFVACLLLLLLPVLFSSFLNGSSLVCDHVPRTFVLHVSCVPIIRRKSATAIEAPLPSWRRGRLVPYSQVPSAAANMLWYIHVAGMMILSYVVNSCNTNIGLYTCLLNSSGAVPEKTVLYSSPTVRRTFRGSWSSAPHRTQAMMHLPNNPNMTTRKHCRGLASGETVLCPTLLSCTKYDR